MRTLKLMLFFAILCAPFHSALAAETAPDADLQAKIKSLIEQLGAQEFDKREEATAELIKVGMPSVELVNEATRSNDPEVAFRAGRILKEVLHGLTMENFKKVQELLQTLRGTSAETISGNALYNLQGAFQQYMPAATPFIEDLLDDPNPIARYAACCALARVRNDKALQIIDNFLNEYGPLADGRKVDEKEQYKLSMLSNVMRLLNYYGRARTTAIAEKYLRQPYARLGILRYGMWDASHYDAFAAFAQQGMLDNGEVIQYFLNVRDNRIAPFLKEQLKEGKQVKGALTVLAGIAPDDPDTKDLLLQYAQVDDYCNIAVALLVKIDAEAAGKSIREKMNAYFAVADKNKPCPFNGSDLLSLLRGIEGSNALDILESAALMPQLQRRAIGEILSLPLPDIDKSQVIDGILSKCQDNPVPLLETCVECRNSDLLRFFSDTDISRSPKDPDYEKTLRILVGLDYKDPAGYLLKKLPEIADTDAQLRMLALIATTRNGGLLADVEKAFDGFEARHRQYLTDKFKKPGGENQGSEKLVARTIAADMFKYAFYLNMLGKRNEADLRAQLINNDCAVPRFSIPRINDGNMPGFSQTGPEIMRMLLNGDADNKLKSRIHEMISKILEQEYIFDTILKRPEDAAFPAYDEQFLNYWLDFFAMLVNYDDKEIITQAANLLEKHGAHPSHDLVRIAANLRQCQRPAVVRFIRAYCEEIVKTKPPSENLIYDIFSIAQSMGGVSPPDAPDARSPVQLAQRILDQLKE